MTVWASSRKRRLPREAPTVSAFPMAPKAVSTGTSCRSSGMPAPRSLAARNPNLSGRTFSFVASSAHGPMASTMRLPTLTARLHWGLAGVPEQLESEHEECYWELEKFIRLALKANPGVDRPAFHLPVATRPPYLHLVSAFAVQEARAGSAQPARAALEACDAPDPALASRGRLIEGWLRTVPS